MAECEKVCKYIDLPLQHASADVLRRMRRPGNREAYDKLLARIRARVPGRHAAHHVHRRLPWRDRSRTSTSSLDFVRDTGFDHVGVFTYSHEEGTRAFAMADDVPAEDESGAARRGDAAAAADRRRAAARRGSASHVRVMVDGPSPESDLVAARAGSKARRRTSTPIVYLDECDPSALAPGRDRRRPRITGARGYDLVADAVARL